MVDPFYVELVRVSGPLIIPYKNIKLQIIRSKNFNLFIEFKNIIRYIINLI